MKIIRWLDDNLEEALLIALLVTMTLLMGLQVFSRYILNASLSWSEELTRYLFIWSGFLSISYCIKKWNSIKIDQVILMFPKPVYVVCTAGVKCDPVCAVCVSGISMRFTYLQ
ncbi:MAG: TRAP transporter small permease [[Clostridium] innocuum]